MAEQTITAKQLLTLFEAADHPGAEIQLDGVWRPLVRVVTDYNDESEPILVDLQAPRERRLMSGTDDVTVRGLPEPDGE